MDSRVIWIVAVVTLAIFGLVYGQKHAGINSAISAAWNWLWKTALDKKTCKVAEEFCLEAAVLWFVFPLLDSLYDPAKKGQPVLTQANLLAAMFLVFAVILAHVGKDG